MNYPNNNIDKNNFFVISHKLDYITKNTNSVVNIYTHPFTASVSLN